MTHWRYVINWSSLYF